MNGFVRFMKRNYKVIIIVAVISVALWSFIPREKATDPEKDKMLLELLTFVIEKGHYNPAPIDDTFSKGVYKDYIEALDPSKRFFLQSDIDEFAKYELQIDDQIKNKDLSFFDLTYNRLMQRMEESKEYYKVALENPFDYKKDESINTDYEKMPYAKTKDELKERWRLQVKLSALSSLVEKQKIEEEKSKDKDKKEAPKSFEQLEKETRESTLKSLNDNFNFIKDLDREDWFSVYINAISSRLSCIA